LKKKIIKALVLTLKFFDKVFQVDCDASVVDFGTMLSQEGRLIELFNEKWNKENIN
jgi:hypothetical protein